MRINPRRTAPTVPKVHSPTRAIAFEDAPFVVVLKLPVADAVEVGSGVPPVTAMVIVVLLGDAVHISTLMSISTLAVRTAFKLLDRDSGRKDIYNTL